MFDNWNKFIEEIKKQVKESDENGKDRNSSNS